MATKTILGDMNVDEIGFSFLAIASGAVTSQNSEFGYVTYSATNATASLSWSGIAACDGMALAIANGSATVNAMYERSVAWTAYGNSLPSASAWTDLAAGDNTFVAIATGGTTAATTSPRRGEAWATRTLPSSAAWSTIAAGLISTTTYFITATSNSNTFAYSTDRGATWTGSTLPMSGNWQVRYGNGRFVAVSSGSADAIYSTDGTTWSSATLPSSTTWADLTYVNNIWVATCSSGTAGAYSTDGGATWTSMTMPASGNWKICAGKNIEGINMFIAMATSSTNGAYSTNGYTWSTFTAPNAAWSRFRYLATTWASVDTLVINSGATVTANTNQTKGWGIITITSGKLKIQNTSTTTANRFLMTGSPATAQRSITPTGLGTIEIVGDRIQIGTGDNSASQTMTAPYVDYIPAVWVETGNGTGVYEQWLNCTKVIGYAQPVWRNEGFGNVGNGKSGNYFMQTGANPTTFGAFTLSSGATYTNSRYVTVTSTTNVQTGAHITGTGISANTVVEEVISSTVLRINVAATATNTGLTLTINNPTSTQMTGTLTFGDGTHGNKIPTGARVWIPNILCTDTTAVTNPNALTVNYYFGLTLSSAGKLYVDTCLFSFVYGNFNQATVVNINYSACVYAFQLSKIPSLTLSNFGLSNNPFYNVLASGTVWFFTYSSSSAYENITMTYCPNAVLSNIHVLNYGGAGYSSSLPNVDTNNGAVNFSNGCDGATCTNLRHTAMYCRSGGVTAASHFSSNTTFDGIESYGNGCNIASLSYGNNLIAKNGVSKPGVLNERGGITNSSSYLSRVLRDASLNLPTNNTKYYLKVRSVSDYGIGYQQSQWYDSPACSYVPFVSTGRGSMIYAGANPSGTANQNLIYFFSRAPLAASTPAYEIYRSTTQGFSTRDDTTILTRQVSSSSSYTDSGATNGTTYYYVIRKYLGSTSLTPCSCASGSATLTTTQNFNAAGTVVNVSGANGTNTLYIYGNYDYSLGFATLGVGMKLIATGIPANTTITSISDDGHSCTISNNLTQDLQAVTVTYAFMPGMVVYHANLKANTKIQSVDSNTQITLDKTSNGVIASAAVVFLSEYFETPEFEATAYTNIVSTNLLLQSSDQTNASWTKTNMTVTSNVRWNSLMDGITAQTSGTADRLTATAGNGTTAQAVTTTIGLAYRFTVWICQEVTTTQANNTVTGSISLGTASQAFTASSTWQKVTVDFTAIATSTTATLTLTNNASTLIISQAQVELVSTSLGLPIATTTTTATITPHTLNKVVSYCMDLYTGTELTYNIPTPAPRYLEVHMGTSAGFTLSESTMVLNTYTPTSAGVLYAYNGQNIMFDNFTQDQPYGVGGYTSSICYAAAGASVTFKNINIPINGSKMTFLDGSVTSPVVTMYNCTFDYPQNLVSNYSQFICANSSKGLTLKNIKSNVYSTPLLLPTLTGDIKGVASGKGGVMPQSTGTDPRIIPGNAYADDTISYTATYDSNFHELYTDTTKGKLRLNFTESLAAVKPYTILSGNPRFDSAGKLYFYNAGDSIEFVWDNKILGVTGFQNIMPFTYGTDLGVDRGTCYALLQEYAIDTGSGYGSYKTLTPANLSAETVSATTGFYLKLRFTCYAGMKISAQSSNFVLNETINGLTSGATARVIGIENNSTGSTSTIRLDTISGNFIAAETIRSGSTNRGTNSATNGFALFPSYTSYVNSLDIFTNVDQSVLYPATIQTITLNNLVVGSRFELYNTTTSVVLDNNIASSATVVASVETSDGDVIRVRVRKPGYVPFETQITMSAGTGSAYISQVVDSTY